MLILIGHGSLEPPGCERSRELPFVHDTESVGRRDLLHHFEGRVRVPERRAELPRRLERAEASDPVVEADDEPDAHHLARGHDVDARALLIQERRLRGVLHELAQIHRAEPAGFHRLAGEPHPPGETVAPHHRGRQQHPSLLSPARPPGGGQRARGFLARISAIARRCSADSRQSARRVSISFRNASKSTSKARVASTLLARALAGGSARKRSIVASNAGAKSPAATTRFTTP